MSDDDTLDRLRTLLVTMTDQQLASIGVTLDRDDRSWEWLRDAFVAALTKMGRHRAASGMQTIGDNQYSVGMSKAFLMQLNGEIRLLMDAEPDAQASLPSTPEEAP